MVHRGPVGSDPDDASDFWRFEKEGFGGETEGALLDRREGGEGVDHIVNDGQGLRRLEAGRRPETFEGDRPEQGFRLLRRDALPEDLDLVAAVSAQEEGKKEGDIDDGMELAHQGPDLRFPVPDNVGGDDEPFDQPDLEGEDGEVGGRSFEGREGAKGVEKAVLEEGEVTGAEIGASLQDDFEGALRLR